MKKQIINVALTAAMAIALASCGSSAEQERIDAAKALSEQINHFTEAHNYTQALALIDTLNTKYSDLIDLRKVSLLQRARVMEAMILDSIPTCDARMAAAQSAMDSLSQFFVSVRPNAKLDGYRVDKGIASASILTGNAVQPRLGDEQIPWTLVVNITKKIGINGLRLLVNGNPEALVNVGANAKARIVSTDAGEMFSFNCEEAEPIAAALERLPQGTAKLEVTGTKGSVTIPLNAATCKAIVRTMQLANYRAEDWEARRQRELLERKLIVARDQIANFDTVPAPAPEH